MKNKIKSKAMGDWFDCIQHVSVTVSIRDGFGESIRDDEAVGLSGVLDPGRVDPLLPPLPPPLPPPPPLVTLSSSSSKSTSTQSLSDTEIKVEILRCINWPIPNYSQLSQIWWMLNSVFKSYGHAIRIKTIQLILHLCLSFGMNTNPKNSKQRNFLSEFQQDKGTVLS